MIVTIQPKIHRKELKHHVENIHSTEFLLCDGNVMTDCMRKILLHVNYAWIMHKDMVK